MTKDNPYLKTWLSKRRVRRHFLTQIKPELIQQDWGVKDCAAKKLEDKQQVFSAALSMIESANQSIYFNMYLFGGDIGDQILSLLTEKQNQGVQVLLILDGEADSYTQARKKNTAISEKIKYQASINRPVVKPDFRQKSSKAKGLGLPVAHMETAFISSNPLAIDHNKLLVVDGIQALVGGMNFCTWTENNHDTMVHVLGPWVEEVEISFINNWFLSYGKPLQQMVFYRDEAARTLMARYLSEINYSLNSARLTLTSAHIKNTRTNLLRQINEASSSIDIAQLLFNDSQLIAAVEKAALRGVKVRLLVDPATNLYGFNWYGGANNKLIERFEDLKQQHPHIHVQYHYYKIKPGAELHVKMVLTDNFELAIGSTNFTSGALDHNYELFAFFTGPLVQDYLLMFNRDWSQQSYPIGKLNLGRKLIGRVSDIIF